MRYVSDYTQTSLSDALRNLAEYLEKDNSSNRMHGSYISDMTKFLKRLTTATIIRRGMEDFEIQIPETNSKTQAIEMYLSEFIKKAEESFGK